ncbi:MAG TPA: pitrilysin family protein [Candidatus Aminicenantes bacterium]|nr:pitrilysin family protein [Candidatus Aminicenantes bacterium]HRY64436.1 pitrilysin family protein [Candidatus Aminicenantes bacterium]HRZ71349.1 pitrilysin family protein [Candidatus Aminicenantes bacterium]
MRKSPSRRAAVAALAAGLVVLAAPFLAAQTAKIDIPYQEFVLDNGLTLIVHEDHKAPIAAFNVWYHVGSKNEKPGKTGFAHLFEHLMFNGSENYNDDYFKPMQKVGATDLNGTTNEDRTNYFENVPVPALDLVLWMESDRMGHLKGAITQAKLDEQRGVVQNELRQSYNEPFGITEDLITKGTYPPGHPYSWSVGGSIEDLSSGKLEDFQQWFATYYGPNNAVIVIAGDIDAKTVFEKVKRYFGDIPPSPPIARPTSWVAPMSGTHRESVQDRVAQARFYKYWNVPGWGTECADKLDLVSSILADGKTSRFYKRLVYDDQIASSVAAYVNAREIGGQFAIQADAKPGVDLAKVEKAINEELARFLKEGPTAAELERVKVQYRARFIQGIERIGGFGGKSDILATSQVYGGSPDAYKKVLKHVEDATVDTLKESANRWLGGGSYVLEVHPYPALSAGKSDVDRKTMPAVGAAPQASFPAVQRATLSNGLKIMLAERHSIPVVQFALALDAGFAADQGVLAGTAALAMNMLDEGTAKRTALQISDELALLGASIGTGSSLDISSVSLTALKDKLDPALDIYADVILHPAFPEADFARLQKLQLARIAQEKASPYGMALRVFPKLIYGEGHPYAIPFTGSGNAEAVAKITRADLVKFHQTWFKPSGATMIVVGDTTLAEIKPKLEKLFQGWTGGRAPAKKIAAVPLAAKPSVYIMDKPDAPQSLVVCGFPAPSSADPDNVAITTMNMILGGDFVSRINMNIREDKHWSYGAQSAIVGARGQRPFLVLAPVQSDKTKETMVEIKGELEGILGPKPITNDEYANAKNNIVLGLPGQWETMGAVLGSIEETVAYGLPDDYYQKYPGLVQKLTIADLSKAAAKTLHPGSLIWVVVGDRAKIEPKIRELGFPQITVIDADGNPVK